MEYFWWLEPGENHPQAKIASQSLRLGKEKAITDLEVGIDKFYSQLQNALDNVKALDTTIEMSRELVRVRKKSFQEGMATSTEVVDAEVKLNIKNKIVIINKRSLQKNI